MRADSVLIQPGARPVKRTPFTATYGTEIDSEVYPDDSVSQGGDPVPVVSSLGLERLKAQIQVLQVRLHKADQHNREQALERAREREQERQHTQVEIRRAQPPLKLFVCIAVFVPIWAVWFVLTQSYQCRSSYMPLV